MKYNLTRPGDILLGPLSEYLADDIHFGHHLVMQARNRDA